MTDESQQTRMNRLINAMPEVLSEHDSDGCFLFATSSCEKIFGITTKELLKHKLSDFASEDEREQITKVFSESWTNEAPRLIHFHICTTDTDDRWLETTVRPTQEGTYVAVTREVSWRTCSLSQKHLCHHESVSELSARFESAINSPRDTSIVMLDPEGRIVLFNDAFESVVKEKLGIEVKSGDTFSDLIHTPTYKRRFIQAIDVALQGEYLSRDFNVGAFEQELDYSISFSPVTHPANGIIGVTLFIQDITKRTRLERDYREKAENYSLLLNGVDEGIGISDENENFIFINPAGTRIFGCTSQDLVGRNLLDFISEKDRQLVTDQTLLRQDNITSSYQLEILPENGEPRTILVSASPQKMETGQIRTFAVFRDVTERERAEEALKTSERRLKALFELLPDAIFIAETSSGQIVDVNPAAGELTGYSLEELRMLNQSEVKLDEGKEVFSDFTTGKLNETEPVEARLIRKDGQRVPVEIRARRIEFLGQPHILATFRDMSTRYREQERTRFQSQLLNAVQQSVIATDRRGKIIYWNGYAERMFGWKAREVVGTMITEIRSEKLHAEWSFEATRHLRPGQSWSGEIIIQRRDGSRIPILASTSPIYDRLGHMIGTLGVSTDITVRKEFERSLKQARQVAEEASEAKSIFLANMSHEIRTPMNSILGFSELLSDMIDDEDQLEFLDAVKVSANSLMKLINDILDLSRIEAGSMRIDPKPVNSRTILSEMQNIFQQNATSKGLDFTVAVDDDLPKTVILDEIRVRQILINLIGNAIKFTEEGYVSVDLKSFVSPTTDDRIDLYLTVSDSGPGIPEDEKENIFQAFVQVDKQDQRKFGGTGLGLAITSRLVSMMDGTITLESKLGVGSSFIVKLPCINIPSPASAGVSNSTAAEHSIRLAPARILLMEDEIFNRRLIREFLHDQPLEVIEASDGEKGLAEARQTRPDLILLDLRMPVMDGYQTLLHLKQDDTLNDVPVIVLSAGLFEQEESRALESGAEMFLRKPLSRHELIEAMSRYLPAV